MEKTTEEAVLTDGIINITPQVSPNQIADSNHSVDILTGPCTEDTVQTFVSKKKTKKNQANQ